MMGRNHLVSAAAIAGSSTSVLLAARTSEYRMVSETADAVIGWLVPHSGAAAVLYLFLCTALLLIGSLTPDIDHQRSLLGRHLPSIRKDPVHRGLTHTDWLWLPVLGLGLFEPTRFLVFAWIGIQSHLELDGLSRAGRVRGYPLTSHRVIRQGDQLMVVRSGYWRGLYRTNKPSETYVLIAVLTACFGAGVSAWIVF